MEMINMLTRGFASEFWRTGGCESESQPVVQVLDIKKIVPSSGRVVYRLMLSDGEYFVKAMVNWANDVLKKYCLIRLINYRCNTINNIRICVVYQYQVIQDVSPTAIIGNNVQNVTNSKVKFLECSNQCK